MQAIFCYWNAISRNISDRPFLKKSPGRPYETSCYIFVTVVTELLLQISNEEMEVFLEQKERKVLITGDSHMKAISVERLKTLTFSTIVSK